MFFRLTATVPMAVFHLNNNEHKDDKETEELIFIKGGRPAFFAVKRMIPELASSAPQMSPEENIYQKRIVRPPVPHFSDSWTP